MPTYEYMCEECGKFESFQKITDEPHKKCPRCGSREISRLISASNVIFKGSGFYVTDNRGSDYKSKAKDKETKAS
ncbi:MAG: zinc ribbon domain-containing protein [Halanaerobium sp.]|nr:zinc ribbon domain-containing protein [Halanaerobium sp.]